jgi:peptide/nickel transport system ATP-binding protein
LMLPFKRNYQLLKDSARNGNEYHIYFTWFIVVSSIAHRVLVMYQREIVEQGSKQILKIHNIIIQALIASRPSRFSFEEIAYDSRFLKRYNKCSCHPRRQTRFHDKLYSQTPILKSVMWKEYFLASFFGKKSGFKAVNDVVLSVWRD